VLVPCIILMASDASHVDTYFPGSLLHCHKGFRPLPHRCPSGRCLGEKESSFTLLPGNMQMLYCKRCFNLINVYAMDLGLVCLMTSTYGKAFLRERVGWMCKVTWALYSSYKEGQEGIGELRSSVQNAWRWKYQPLNKIQPKATEENTLVAWQS